MRCEHERVVMRTEQVRASVVGILALLLLVAGCTPLEEQPVPTDAASSTPTSAPTPTADPDPVLVDGGTAGQNRPFFEFVLTEVLADDSTPSSRALVDSLVDAGFDKAAMEVTTDTTPVGQPADSILVSVLIDGQCLIGQIIDSELTSQLTDVLGSGRCLVGRTLSIDW
jgi:hypothetical protein